MKNSNDSSTNGKRKKKKKFKCHGPCGKELPEEDFHKISGRNRPVNYICRRCSADRQRKAHRAKIIKESCESILDEKVCATSSRAFNNNLKYILEQQFKLFHLSKSKTALGHLKITKLIDDAMFEISQALTRLADRVSYTVNNESDHIAQLSNGGEKDEACELLGVSADSPVDKIKEAYIEKARKAHPDHGGSVEEMQLLNKAYELLKKGELFDGKKSS